MLKPHIKVCRYKSGRLYWRVSRMPKVKPIDERIQVMKTWQEIYMIVNKMNAALQARNEQKFWQV